MKVTIVSLPPPQLIPSKTRRHSSRMSTARLPTVHTLVATRCQYQWEGRGGPQVNKFEQVSSDGNQMSLVGDRIGGPMSDVSGGAGGSTPDVQGGGWASDGGKHCTVRSNASW